MMVKTNKDMENKLKQIKFFYENKQLERCYHVDEQDRKQGVSEWYYISGQLIIRCNYKDGKLDGPYETWYENGQMWERSNYKNGKFDGLCESWHNNGQMRSRGNYKDNKHDGLHEEWDRDGKL